MGLTTRSAGHPIGTRKPRAKPSDVADHRLQWLARGLRDRFPHWPADGQDGNWSETRIEGKLTGSSALIERTNPAASKAGGYCRQKDVFCSNSRVLETVKFATSPTIAPGRLLGIGADDDSNRRLSDKLLAVSCRRQPLSYLWIAHHKKVPGLAIARRRGTDRSLQDTVHRLGRHVHRGIKISNTVSTLYNLPEIHFGHLSFLDKDKPPGRHQGAIRTNNGPLPGKRQRTRLTTSSKSSPNSSTCQRASRSPWLRSVRRWGLR